MAYHVKVSLSEYGHEADAQGKLETILPNEWLILSNPPKNRTGFEVDCLVIGPKGLLVIEIKDWENGTRADDVNEWTLNDRPIYYGNGRPKKNPVTQANNAAREFKNLFQFETGINFWVDACALAGPYGLQLEYTSALVQNVVRPLQEANELLAYRVALGERTRAGCKKIVEGDALQVLKYFGVENHDQAKEWFKSAYSKPYKSESSQRNTGSSQTDSPKFDPKEFFAKHKIRLRGIVASILTPDGFGHAVPDVMIEIESAWDGRATKVEPGAEIFLNQTTKALAEAKLRKLLEERAKRRRTYTLWIVAALATLWFVKAILEWLDDPPPPPPAVTQAPPAAMSPEALPNADPITEPTAPKPLRVHNSFLVSYLSNADMQNYRIGNSVYNINSAGSGFVADNGVVRFGYLGDFDGDVAVRPNITLAVGDGADIFHPTHCFYDHNPAEPVAGQQIRSRTICGFEIEVKPGIYNVNVLYNGENISSDRLKVNGVAGASGSFSRPKPGRTSEGDAPTMQPREEGSGSARITCITPEGEERVTDEGTCRNVLGGVPYR